MQTDHNKKQQHVCIFVCIIFYLFLISTGQYPVVFDKTDLSDPTMYCDEFDLKKISNMTETPKVIIIGKVIVLNFHIVYLF